MRRIRLLGVAVLAVVLAFSPARVKAATLIWSDPVDAHDIDVSKDRLYVASL